MTVDIVLLTRDLRLHDNPSLAAAATDQVVPLYVLDPAAQRSEFRSRFLADCLHDLDDALRKRGSRLVIRRGDTVDQVGRVAEQVGAATVHLAADASSFARRRERRLAAELGGQRRELRLHPGVHTVVEPGAVVPSGSDHYAVYTPYWRRWSEQPYRPQAAVPHRLSTPEVVSEALPERDPLDGFAGGETAGRARLTRWLSHGLAEYGEQRDILAANGTSRLSAYLHFGCLSATEVTTRAAERGAAAEDFLRQLAWRDFHYQLLARDPRLAWRDYRPRPAGLPSPGPAGGDAVPAWRDGLTGYPLVDAGMRQLLGEGWMHNRARMVTASFLTKTLGVPWQGGAAHFFRYLLDGDIANNALNWQWVAGTGTDSRPNRRLSAVRQGERFDADGEYVRRWVPELSDVPARYVHQPWRLPDADRPGDYPPPIVEPPSSR
ncbi:MAG: deoxyribodipyrimidine photo-lyase [Actinomycetota bacterium]|nr:MAG: deoxyribodipyrimidine photo-lyase [Actinomycetota bacterium]